MFIIIMGDVVDRTSPIIYNRLCSTNVYTTKNTVFKGDRLLWKKSLK